jgi:putative transcriptional regulator
LAKAEIKNDIRRLRFEHGEMTQQELADRIGCTRQTIIMLEQGRYVPSLALALSIAQVFGEPVETIFTLA